jgi:hypothetical protein
MKVHEWCYGFFSLSMFTAIAYQVTNRLVVSSASYPNGKEQDREQQRS